MTGRVEPRGLTVLVIVGIAGIVLAVVGWSQRYTGLVAPAVGGLGLALCLTGCKNQRLVLRS